MKKNVRGGLDTISRQISYFREWLNLGLTGGLSKGGECLEITEKMNSRVINGMRSCHELALDTSGVHVSVLIQRSYTPA
jgi:hypothetical protein